MKSTVNLLAMLALSAAGLAQAHSDNMQGMHDKDMPMKDCMAMQGMKGKDMQGMDMQNCKNMMDQHGKQSGAKETKAVKHQAEAVVKAINPAKGRVTLTHGPVKSLKWPAMTMPFLVKDPALFDKLTVGKKVQVEFMQQGTDYIVTAVK